ncbi:MAG: GNAT family N-acetyltransferase [Desulfuromonadaceae bacterium]|nr:GNAT family N-acetyltransferase [Desulfuromonadaceae bacterium]
MTIKPLTNPDWELFLNWARLEGWSIAFQERRLFLNQWRPYFHVLWHDGRCCGFVSAVIYKTSGWIGNLIIDPQARRQGYGAFLFEYALEQLLRQPSVNRVWLTASQQGEGLYRKHGFVKIDQVDRWRTHGRATGTCVCPQDLNALLDLDLQCWRESRATLLKLLADDGCTIRTDGSVALLQKSLDFWQLGPWSARDGSPVCLKKILDLAVARVPQGKPLLTDVLTSSGAALVLQHAGFDYVCSNVLMCRSIAAVKLKGVVALASLGSIG